MFRKIIFSITFLFLILPVFAEEVLNPLTDKEAAKEYLKLFNDSDLDLNKEVTWQFYTLDILKATKNSGPAWIIAGLYPEKTGFYIFIKINHWYNCTQEVPQKFDTFFAEGHFSSKGPFTMTSRNGTVKIDGLFFEPEKVILHPYSPKPEELHSGPVTIYDQESKAYVDRIVPPIFSNWSKDELLKEADSEFSSGNIRYPETLDSTFRRFNDELGSLVKYDGSWGAVDMNTIGLKDGMSAHYKIEIEYERGKATLNLKLINRGRRWKILYFYLKSPQLLPIK